MADETPSEGTRRDWEPIQDNPGESRTERLKVPGGWLYRTITYGPSAGVALVFVPGSL